MTWALSGRLTRTGSLLLCASWGLISDAGAAAQAPGATGSIPKASLMPWNDNANPGPWGAPPGSNDDEPRPQPGRRPSRSPAAAARGSGFRRGSAARARRMRAA